jgi:ABC-type uncharacterized transport system auxiliary subunit
VTRALRSSARARISAVLANEMTLRHIFVFIAVCAAALGASCISLDVGGEASPQAQYRLEDLSRNVTPRAAPIDRRLLVSILPSEAIGDTYSMAYSRMPQQRQYYQFASWTDRPSARIARLLTDRLQARSLFESTAQFGTGIGGGLILNVGVDEFVHDVPSATARIQLTVELIDRRGRTLVERRHFTASAPVAQENAAAAVAAWSRALTSLLDEIVPWVERTAESLPPPEPRPDRGKS